MIPLKPILILWLLETVHKVSFFYKYKNLTLNMLGKIIRQHFETDDNFSYFSQH